MRFGKIPSKMALICAAPTIFKCGWEDIKVSIAEDREVHPCFATDAESAESIATGKAWAQHLNIRKRQPDAPVLENVEENSPRKLTIVGLDVRQEGGRGWKVIDSENRLFDLREDVLMETLMSLGGTPGGLLNGEFVFARVGSQMRLIRVGSALHAEMLKGEARRTSSNIPEAELEVGGLYTNRKGMLIYLGRIDTIEEIFVGFGMHCKPITALATAEYKKLATSGKTDVVQSVEVIGEHVSLQLSKWDQPNPEHALNNSWLNGGNGLQFGKSLTAVEFVKKLEIADNIIERFRMKALQRLDQMLTQMEHPKYVDGFGEQIVEMKRARVREVSAMGNLKVHGQGGSISTEYAEALTRCDKPLA